LADQMGPHQVAYKHPGFCWACTRQAFETFGGLLDTCILGSADWHMAYAILGDVDATINKNYSEGYKDCSHNWQTRALKLGKRFGYMDGAILHHWHGSQPDRKYNERWKVLANSKFNPHTDLCRDYQGLWQLNEHNHELREALYQYMKNRREDN